VAHRKFKAALLAAATMSSLVAVGISAGTSAAGASGTVNWSKVTHLTKTGPTDMAALIKAAKKEGRLNVIALPDNWANYGTILKDFKKTYGINISDQNPEGSSAEEITAMTDDRGRSDDPDVIDVGTNFAVSAQADGELAPYKVQTWNEIPANLKQSGGYWFDDYGGYVAIGCDTATVTTCPTSFAQILAAPASAGYKVGINNSPTSASAALAAVWAASIAEGGSLSNIAPGVTYFANLNKEGYFVPTVAGPSTVQSGATNIVIWWDYLQASEVNAVVKGWKVVVPTDALFAEYYTQAINKSAPDPAAARLWEEYLYSVTGQNLWLQGEARPAELAYMEAHGTANKTWEAALPAVPKGSTNVPTPAEITAAETTVTSTWPTEVTTGP
jgi:putative spermidine/putrescine transport system substrate-binding protein